MPRVCTVVLNVGCYREAHSSLKDATRSPGGDSRSRPIRLQFNVRLRRGKPVASLLKDRKGAWVAPA
jgi:hypothetical protein